MEIIYSAIAFNRNTILVDYSLYEGRDPQKITSELLKSGINQNERAFFKYDSNYIFYYINLDAITYVCTCTADYPQASAFFFLEEVTSLFDKIIKPGDYTENSPSYCLNEVFQASLKGKMEQYNINPKKDEVDTLTEQLVGFKNTVMEANENLFKRGKEIDIIGEKADRLQDEAKFYAVSALKVKKSERNKKVWVTIALVFVVLAIIYGGLVIGCSYDLSDCIKFT